MDRTQCCDEGQKHGIGCVEADIARLQPGRRIEAALKADAEGLGAGAVEFLIGQLPITRRRRAAFVVPTTLGSCLLVAAFPYRDSVLVTPVCTLWHGSKWIKLSLTG